MATASVLFEKTQDEAGGVERSCSDDVIRDALTPMSLDLDGGFSMRYSASVRFAGCIFLGCCRPQKNTQAMTIGVAFSSNLKQHGEWR